MGIERFIPTSEQRKASNSPQVSIFDLMPHKAAPTLSEGSRLTLNTATHVHPLREMDFHRFVASHPRWMQGIPVRIVEVEPASDMGLYKGRTFGVLPADMAFTGVVEAPAQDTNSPARLVRGVIHPRVKGWVEITHQPGDEIVPMRTVADLKYEIRRLGAYNARVRNEEWRTTELFTINERNFS